MKNRYNICQRGSDLMYVQCKEGIGFCRNSGFITSLLFFTARPQTPSHSTKCEIAKFILVIKSCTFFFLFFPSSVILSDFQLGIVMLLGSKYERFEINGIITNYWISFFKYRYRYCSVFLRLVVYVVFVDSRV